MNARLCQSRRAPRGVALISVLAILTVLAVLCATYAVLSTHELAASRLTMAQLQDDLLARSACAHVQAMLAFDDPAYDAYTEPWGRRFAQQPPHVFLVRNALGECVGQYAVRVSDNAALINLNVAGLARGAQSNVPYVARGGGLSQISIDHLLLGPHHALNRRHAAALVQFRYGRDRAPGIANYDDNLNQYWCVSDGIDNNGNGIVDEPADGIDEAEEYTPHHPAGDDRCLSSVHEAAALLPLQRSAVAALQRCATAWIDEPLAGAARLCAVNGADSRALLRSLRIINRSLPFERAPEALRERVCRVLDARDENHALSTIASAYGVEAVCFNEILANDGSVIAPIQAYTTSGGFGEQRVPRAGAPYALLYRSYFVSRNRDNPSLAMYNQNKRSRNGGYVFTRARIGTTAGDVASLVLDLDDLHADGANYPAARRAMAQAYTRAGGATWPADLFAGACIDFPYDDEGRFLNDETNFPGIERKHMWVGSARFEILSSGPQPGHFRVRTKGWDTLPWGNTRAFEYDPEHYQRTRYQRHLSAFTNAHCHLVAWQYFDTSGDWTSTPGLSDAWIFPGELPDQFALRPTTYYAVALYSRSDNFNDGNYGDERWFTEYFQEADELDTDGDVRRRSATPLWRRRRWYQDGVPIRSSPRGTMEVVLTSGERCTAEPGREQIARLYSVMFMRPEVVELINLSRAPLSIFGWQLVANSGSLATPIATLDRAHHYRTGRRMRLEDNPVIAPHSYAYITTHEALFDLEFGGRRSGLWGDSADESLPLHVITNSALWGVHYRISGVGGRRTAFGASESWISVKPAAWRPNELAGEYIEIVKRDNPPFPNSLHNADGIRLMITRNTRDTLFVEGAYLPVPDAANYEHGEVGEYVTTKDDFYLCGLPSSGGLVSLTLKDHYGQVAARTLNYNPGVAVTPGSSFERPDPVGAAWLVARRASIGGTDARARNASLRPGLLDKLDPCNRPLASLADLQRVLPRDTTPRAPRHERDFLRAAAASLHTDGVRLFAHAAARSTNWHSTLFVVAGADTTHLVARDAQWRPGIWRGQTVRIVSGASAGACFPVRDNTTHTLLLGQPTTSGAMLARVAPGDRAVVGPAYLAPLDYTLHDALPGEWHWPASALDPRARYACCTLMGLNDSIDTTEFLEENHNAALDVELYDHTAKRFVLVVRRGRYDKNDALQLGPVAAPFISPTGGVRLRITPHEVHAQRCSGFAWFNYLYCAPAPVLGRININTASPQVLAQIPDVSPQLARDIAHGIDPAGAARLLPYTDAGALLAVRGMSSRHFAGMVPFITTRSAVFLADVQTHTFQHGSTQTWSASHHVTPVFVRAADDAARGNAVTMHCQ